MSQDYLRIEKLLNYLDANTQLQPSLDDLGKLVNLSPFHLQKLFKNWAGVSPKQYLKLATLSKAKQYLRSNNSVLATSDLSGLSSSSRLYDHFVSVDAVTPGEFKSGGVNVNFFYGLSNSPYGSMFVAWTERGIHRLLFSNVIDDHLRQLKAEWPEATFIKQQKPASELLKSFFENATQNKNKITLRLLGSDFQLKVWKALLSIPPGECISYGELAKLLGKPNAARAVGSAVGANSLALLIPCHRVIQASGNIGEYRWGELRKRIVLAREQCLYSTLNIVEN